MTFRPKFISFDCHGTMIYFDMAGAARDHYGAQLSPEQMDVFIRDFSAYRLDEVLQDFKPYAEVVHNALERTCKRNGVAFDPAVQERARTEAREVLGDRPAGAEDVANLPYIRQILLETMRLYPPVAILSRTAMKPDQLRDREVRAGDVMLLPFYALHRSEVLWDDPNGFDPDRFADPKAIDRYAFLPFGAGPRVCLGMDFAMQEAVIVLATMLARFRFTAIPGRDPEPVMILSLRPKGGVWLDVEPV